MKYYPVFLDIKGRDCLVVGGGPVGVRKAKGLEKCGANVTVISQEFCQGFNAIRLKVTCHEKSYEAKDARGMFFVFAATDNARLNQQIKADALNLNILCNVADAPDKSDFLLPSIVEQGDLVIAVSTSGSSPAMAKTIKKDLAQRFGSEYETFLALMGNIRKDLLACGHAPDRHKEIFYALIEKDILELIKAGDEIKINSVLSEVLGKKYTFQNLVSVKE
jgi:precorrin-2 dehydrogenase/sirohydrochlorin ferrochelatase